MKCKNCFCTKKGIIADTKSLESNNKVILIIGEAPGINEIKNNQLFIGRSGKILREIIYKSQLSNFIITNLIKCKLENNRIPKKIEILNCSIHLKKELKIFKPYKIILLGNTVNKGFNFLFKIGKIKNYHFEDKLILRKKIYLAAIPHPAYFVYRNDKKKELIDKTILFLDLFNRFDR